jgi:sulfur transfer complex TusBCD TusB component (DsrH family)
LNDAESENAVKTRAKAQAMHPEETWLLLEAGIYIASTRTPHSKKQTKDLEKELVQARMLTARGSVIYLLPEKVYADNIGEKHPDAVVDGEIMEFKTITGNVREIERRFKESRLKSEQVFFHILSDLTRREVTRKLSGVIRRKDYQKGVVIAFFAQSSEMYFWDINDLR